MKYLLMIYSDEAADALKTASQQDDEMKGYFAFTGEVKNASVYQGGEALYPTSTATTVRVRGGKIGTTDGPFAETKSSLAASICSNAKIWMRRSSGRQRFRALYRGAWKSGRSWIFRKAQKHRSNDMDYMFLMYAEKEMADTDPEQLDRQMAIHRDIISDAKARGVFKSASPLHPVATAVTVRPAQDKVTITDGPFAETKRDTRRLLHDRLQGQRRGAVLGVPLGGYGLCNRSRVSRACIDARTDAARSQCLTYEPQSSRYFAKSQAGSPQG